jgi:DNA helicase-2/ATP-dependent DNA helicase PcrA
LDELQNECKKFSKNISVSDVICHLKKMEMKELFRTKTKEETNVFLYTYHGSKGLEFDMVFCIDVNEGIVPSPYCNGDVEEERRMFYVAITRAKSDLYISCIKIRGGKTYSPSVFINEMKY